MRTKVYIFIAVLFCSIGVYAQDSAVATPVEGNEIYFQKFSQQFNESLFSGANLTTDITLVIKITKNGDARIIDAKNLPSGLDKTTLITECKRVLAVISKWKPAKENGQNVQSMIEIPLHK